MIMIKTIIIKNNNHKNYNNNDNNNNDNDKNNNDNYKKNYNDTTPIFKPHFLQ